MMKIAGSRSASGYGSISQSGSADPDADLHQNVIDPQHWVNEKKYPLAGDKGTYIFHELKCLLN
jgi:hypothetical protein